MDARKPLQRIEAPAPPAMESTEPHSIRFTPTAWGRICAAARERGLEPAVYVRRLTLMALEFAEAQKKAEAALGIPSAGAQGISGNLRF